MTNSGSFQTRRLDNFDKSYKEIVKSHYPKNRQDRERFEEQIARFLSLLRSDPHPPPPFGHTEPWPNGSYQEGWELWKLNFDMPGLKGQAKHGRLIYMVDAEEATLYLLWIYTHAKFKGRPPEKSLRQLTQEAVEERKSREKQ